MTPTPAFAVASAPAFCLADAVFSVVALTLAFTKTTAPSHVVPCLLLNFPILFCCRCFSSSLSPLL